MTLAERILRELARADDLTAHEVALRLRRRSPTRRQAVTNALTRLHRSGQVTREVAPRSGAGRNPFIYRRVKEES